MSTATETSHRQPRPRPPAACSRTKIRSQRFRGFREAVMADQRGFSVLDERYQALSANVREKLAPHSRVCFFRTSLVGSRSVVTEFRRER
jgi:hypothetical protein